MRVVGPVEQMVGDEWRQLRSDLEVDRQVGAQDIVLYLLHDALLVRCWQLFQDALVLKKVSNCISVNIFCKCAISQYYKLLGRGLQLTHGVRLAKLMIIFIWWMVVS